MYEEKCQNGMMNTGEDGPRRKGLFDHLIITFLDSHSGITFSILICHTCPWKADLWIILLFDFPPMALRVSLCTHTFLISWALMSLYPHLLSLHFVRFCLCWFCESVNNWANKGLEVHILLQATDLK